MYRKSTKNDIYLSCEYFAPGKWKWGTLETLTKRAYHVCSNQERLQKEVNHIEKVFRANKNYPKLVIEKGFIASQTTATTATTKNSRCSQKE